MLVPLVVAVLGLLIVQYLVLIKQIELLMLKHAGVVTQISRFLTRSAAICAMPPLPLITSPPPLHTYVYSLLASADVRNV